MDHFALPSDPLTKAFKSGTLHRNFMGYGTNATDLMIGLGVSSISDSRTAFAQNEKVIRNYEKRLDQEEFPIFRGHLLTNEDLILRQHILNLMCAFHTEWSSGEDAVPAILDALLEWKEMENDGLLILESDRVTVTEKGKPFVRNICMALDARLKAKKPETRIFSSTV
jgi:oxygen-independent coproporphyrinogen-3 oxidase